jgi:chromate transporter
MSSTMQDASHASERVPLAVIARQWGRIGCIGFGGPPSHIALLRRLCVEREGWMTGDEFEDGVATTNLLPGPASTQLAILAAWRLRATAGAVVGGFCFIVPGLVVILALAVLFLAGSPPLWARGAAAGSGSAVAAVAVKTASELAPSSWRRAGPLRAARARWTAYALTGGAAAALVGPFLVLVLIGAGLLEAAARARGPHSPRPPRTGGSRSATAWPFPLATASAGVAAGGLAALAWVAFKVGALSYGGGFVIVPLMQHDAVDRYHWMTSGQFLTAVALGQITPGPVVQTVAVVGYAAAGVGGGLLASLIAFGPSFLFVLAGARHFDTLRSSARVQAFLTGAGPAAVGAIAGSAIPLALALRHPWQYALLAAAALWLLAGRRAVVSALLAAAGAGTLAALLGAPLS